MAVLRLKLVKMGNSRGVRLPARLIRRYRLSHVIDAETTKDGILLKPGRRYVAELSWSEAARAMARTVDDCSDWKELKP